MREYIDQEIALYKPIEVMYLLNGKVSPLQRWLDSVIDLDKIFKIEDARASGLYNEFSSSYSGRTLVVFSISLVNSPNDINYRWRLQSFLVTITKEEYDKNPHYPNSNYGGSYQRSEIDVEGSVKKCQETIVDDLIKVWRMYREG